MGRIVEGTRRRRGEEKNSSANKGMMREKGILEDRGRAGNIPSCLGSTSICSSLTSSNKSPLSPIPAFAKTIHG